MKIPHTIIIAEAGVNHNGSIKLAKKLIDAAAEAGADYVKFQTFKAEELVAPHADKAEYQKGLTNANETQFDMIKKLELDRIAHKELMDYCNQKKIKFLSTAFDLPSIRFLNNLNLKRYKIPSGEIDNFPYIREIAKTGKPIIPSNKYKEIVATPNLHPKHAPINKITKVCIVIGTG